MFTRLATPLFVKIAGLGIIAALAFAGLQSYRLNTARRAVAECAAQEAELRASLAIQNERIRALAEQSERAKAESRRLKEQADRANARDIPTIRNLERSSQTPRNPSDPCVISDAIRNARGL